jgi:hypothetical protein
MKSLFPIGAIALAAMLSTSFSEVSAECNMPDPPIFHAQNRIFAFEELAPAQQDEVKAFESLASGDLHMEKPIFGVEDGDSITVKRLNSPGGTPDKRTPEERYLDPDHPGGQPAVPQSAWKRVNCVDLGEPLDVVEKKCDDKQCETLGGKAEQSFTITLPEIKGPQKIRTSFVRTADSIFPGKVDIDGDGEKETVDPYANPPGTNMLPTVFANLRNTRDREILNTLPSTKVKPYNLHAEKPIVTRINPESPADDLKYIMTSLYEVIANEPYEQYLIRSDKVSLQDAIDHAEGASERVIASRSLMKHHIQWALDIIEGNGERGTKVPIDRAYRGLALLNHSGHKRVKRVMPVYDANGEVTGGEVTIRQIWYGGRIQSDTAFLDFGYEKRGSDIDYANCGGVGQPTDEDCRTSTKVPPIPPNKPWNIHFEISVLNNGNDDFSPMTMHFDCPRKLSVDGVSIDLDDAKDHCPGEDYQLPNGKPSWSAGPLYASTDQSFFPMTDGTQVDLTLKMAPPQFYNLSYTWGWRVHPPRAQVVENGEKLVPPWLSTNPENPINDTLQMYCHPLRASIIEHERWAFEGFTNPSNHDRYPSHLPKVVAFPAVRNLAKKIGLALPDGAPMGEGEELDACFSQFKEALTRQHFKDTGAMLRADNLLCKKPGWRSDDGKILAPPDMMDARLCLLNFLFPPPVANGDYDPAIDKIADIAPAKRMWRSFRAMRTEANKEIPPGADEWIQRLRELRSAYVDWLNRSQLPSGVQPDPKSDLTLLYVNNTIYGQLRTGGYVEFPDWRRRGDMAKITLLNGDYFPHGYLNVDFGGARGWENLWQSTVKTAGSGPWFTFGRFHARFNTVPGAIVVGAAKASDATNVLGAPENVQLAAHRLMLEYNFEPNPRLRFYQFDPLHHDLSIYSIH